MRLAGEWTRPADAVDRAYSNWWLYTVLFSTSDTNSTLSTRMNYLIFLYRARTLGDTRRRNKLALSIVLKEARCLELGSSGFLVREHWGE